MPTDTAVKANIAAGRLSSSPAAKARPNRVTAFLNRHIAPISFVILLVVIEICVRAFKVPEYILPTPSQILRSLIAGFSTPIGSPNGFYVHLYATGLAAGSSFVGGAILGVVMGAVVVRFSFARRLFYPYIIALQSVPKVALAPLFTVWFGLGFESKVVLGVLLTFFPVLINTAAGLSGVEPDRLELMASMKATAWQTFKLVQLPSAWPFVFAGLELAAIYSILGAVVGEFVGGEAGLGVLILNRNAALDIPGSMAALVVLAVIGIGVQRLVAFVRRKILFWAPSEKTLTREPT
ncbi:ABC transporter permease [Kaistia sp. 32K]|uniref:ABC transporter permease n=1 Tax=Kaistia sp. 32K TaxID=2795690 RepID=UPI001915BE35|nr:ABC transporter permease [Kaistia sp. 32K]BCP52209.1 ABC transporter permease [Kaistia sp. 32K]